MKKILLLSIASMLVCLNIMAAEPPASLSIKGTAVAESNDPIPMKLVGSTYELYTSLKTGDYSFEGDNTIASAPITEEGTLVPYRIRVDYSGDNPVVTVQKIEKVYMWAPWTQHEISPSLEYIGNSMFKGSPMYCNISTWGHETEMKDSRYRIRLNFEGGVLETYGHGKDENSGVDFFLAGNEQWGSSDFNYSVDGSYVNTGVPFEITLTLKADQEYRRALSDYIVPTPDVISIQGEALNESSEPMAMKKSGNIFELFTSLKNGEYSFTGGEGIPSGAITGEEGDLTPYCIRVDYNSRTPIVSVKKVTQVSIWAPRTQNYINNLEYEGNSTFKAENTTYIPEQWDSDPRYRIRIKYEDNMIETYARKDGIDFTIVGNSQWAPSDFNYVLSSEYTGGKPFNTEITLKADEAYGHTFSDYIAPLPKADILTLEGTALEGGIATMKKKSNGVFEFVGTLKTGEYKIKGTTGDKTYYYTIENDVVIEGEANQTVDAELAPCYIKIDLNAISMIVSKVESFKFFFSASGKIADDNILMSYQGNGVFTGSKSGIVYPNPAWGKDSRYKFLMELENTTSVAWGYELEDSSNEPTETTGSYYNLYSVANDDFSYAFKLRPSTDGKKVDFTISFNSNGEYTHSYTVTDLGSGTNEAQVAAVNIYPTAFDSELNILAKEAGITVELISLAGNIVLRSATASDNITINSSDLPNGIYIVRVSKDGSILATQRVIKK